ARELLSNGEILNSKIQPYEAHIPYILKFFIDYNLQGMNFIYVANVDFRCEYENAYIDPKITTCEIEADCIAAEILNNQCLTNDGVNPGLKLILEEERNRRRKESLPSQITPQPSQERNHNEINLKEQSYLVQLRNIVNSYSQSNDIKLSDKSNYSDDELINDASDETFNASEDFIGIVMDLNNISTVSKSRDIVCADSKPSKNDRQTFNDSSINTNSNDESTLNCHPSQSSMGQLSYKTNDLAEMMMRFTNLSGEIDASFEDEDERNLTKEMLQVFKDIDSETNFTHVPQNSPLDLSISSDTENYSDFDVAIKDQNLNSGNNTTLKETNVNNELFAELCDCNSNQCCDICCDKISDGCRKKLEFLRTLCRPLEVEVKFLDSCEKEDDQDSNFSGETTINGNLNDEFHEHNDLSYFDGCTQICSKINGEIEFKNDEEATQDYWDNDFLKNDEDQQLFSKDENTKLEQEENEENAASLNERKFMDSSLIEGPSHSDTFDFDISSFESSFKVGKESNSNNQYITTMCLEVFTSVCGDLKPNPINDSLRAVFYAINYDIPDDVGKKLSLGIILIKTDVTITQTQSNKDSLVYSRKHLLRSAFLKSDVDILYACDEIELYMKLIDIMKVNDPDILVGYEIEMSSWGFLLQRANALNIRIFSALSRVAQEEDDVTGPTLENIEKFGIKITGRIVLNL
ncbi:hypothetical protein B4U79_01204, partial [Dinothrombium tinctorium]